MSEFQHSFSQKNKIFKYIIIIIIDILILIRTISNLNAFFTSHSLSKREIVNAIKRMKNGKAAGADNIPAEIFKTDPYISLHTRNGIAITGQGMTQHTHYNRHAATSVF